MSHESFSRRKFLRDASVTAVVGAAGIAGFDCASVKKRMKYVTLGRTGMKVSQFLGDSYDRYETFTNSQSPRESITGISSETGQNLLHTRCSENSTGNRFNCDTIIDALKKDKAIELFERALKKTGLEYIDGFKVHSMYRHAEDIKSETGVLQAFEQLKRQGKTRHLMMSQHSNTA